MNDSWTVEVLRPRHETIQPEITRMWVESGRYGRLEDAEEWAAKCLLQPKVLGVKIVHHQWSATVISEYLVEPSKDIKERWAQSVGGQ